MTSSICKTLTSVRIFSYRRLPSSVGLLVPFLTRFPGLIDLDISFCNLVQIPDAIGQLSCLEGLNIGGNNFVTLPHCIKELPKLMYLNLEYCKHLEWLPSTLLPRVGGSYARVRYTGLYAFNCPNLSDTEGSTLVVISWMLKMIQVNMQRSVEVVIPGRKIPRWFNKQNSGDSVDLDLSPIMDDNNWIGIAACVTFVVHHVPTQFVGREEYLISYGFPRNRFGLIFEVPIRLKKDFITTELDHHMVLIFFSREMLISVYAIDLEEGTSDLYGVKFATTGYHPEVVEVKSCGYRWVFI
ncbi:hypothetical protein PIB30_017096 [Stylosanthes scabra]|uniref:C-JID domain-containing protein n=1 Tax=Stylosanthes scabra TaxID=79078 RepID=A0ABU6U6G0_9FABA|nr:hypothetical protein [Stylosanthes scabra]